ncbi:MAG: septal ring lytic transglycosylase RlpA family protein [Terriglobales bacterium]
MRRLLAFVLLSIALLSAPLAMHPPSVEAAPALSPVPRAAPPPYQVGIASWYGQFFQGKETTSGHPYNMYAMTAAHRTLPLGTRVRVTNLENHLAVVLTINDRGPVPTTRVIDLSYAAARALHFVGEGLTPVSIDILHRGAQ